MKSLGKDRLLVVHPTGNQFVRHLLAGAVARDQLALFATSFGFHAGAAWHNWLPSRLRQEIQRRTYSLPREKMWSQPWREAVRLAAPTLGLRSLVRHETGWASVDAVYGALDTAVAENLEQWAERHGITTIYGYEDGCAATFEKAKALGLRCTYDLPIAYWQTSQRLLREEAVRRPDWEHTLGGTRDSAAKLARKTRELELADVVVCPSEFVAKSLPKSEGENQRIVVVPFGSPSVSPPKLPEPAAERRGSRLRVLFAGGMSQRKGLADVFEAIRLLDRADVELVVMGSPVAPLEFYMRQCPHFIHEPTRPHAAVLELMRSCDVLVLPSIVEGRALVMQEAMSQGLPIIITPNTGGEDLIDEGITGFLTPIRSPHHLAAKIGWCADHRFEVSAMGERARVKAATYTWDAYVGHVLAGGTAESFSSAPAHPR